MAETERVLLHPARLSRAAHISWTDLGLGFVLGRCLHFDEERFGRWFTETVGIYRTLMTNPARVGPTTRRWCRRPPWTGNTPSLRI
ncbi:DUF1266 domain-containing protein [Streptomyces sp. NPDC045470]|uniref:DUF1266 domain-containing protein n=1 Tax=Streptomyces sp. NPDC045470 TaxID=3155469 RepID=UPI0033DFCD25